MSHKVSESGRLRVEYNEGDVAGRARIVALINDETGVLAVYVGLIEAWYALPEKAGRPECDNRRNSHYRKYQRYRNEKRRES